MSASELRQRIPDPEVLLTLEPEELAGVLLPILRKAGATSATSSINSKRFIPDSLSQQYL
jgi:hypothetical protein